LFLQEWIEEFKPTHFLWQMKQIFNILIRVNLLFAFAKFFLLKSHTFAAQKESQSYPVISHLQFIPAGLQTL
jgi:hypothetical protein